MELPTVLGLPQTSGTDFDKDAAPSTRKGRPSQTLASCTLCRRRKVKCDRAVPCGNCSKTGAECIPLVPSRVARGRQGGRKRMKAETELMDRIAKLEGLVRYIEVQGGIPNEAALSNLTTGSAVDAFRTRVSGPLVFSHNSPDQPMRNVDEPQNQIGVDLKRTKAAPTAGLDRYLGRSFWMSLTEQIQGLKEVLGSSSDEDEVESEQAPLSEPSSLGLQLSNHSSFTLSIATATESLVPPTRHQLHTLCEIYLTHVDPVFKLLHAPSLRKYLQGDASELPCSPGKGGLESLRFAVCYAAIVSMEEDECSHLIGENKEVLLIRYRAATELGLARADFVNTVEISTLQALTIYLLSVRTQDTSRFMWTLTSLAIRIAQALGLHQENTLDLLLPCDKEMRRRTWWQLYQLDSTVAEDRASSVILSADSFSTKLPLNINDGDINFDSSEDLIERGNFTDMTFGLICHEVCDAERQLNYITPRTLYQSQHQNQDSWSERVNLVIGTQRHLEQKYLRYLNMAVPFHCWTRTIADIICAKLWLYLYRPLQRDPEDSSSPQIGDPGILRLGVEILEKMYLIETSPVASRFRWVSKTHVQWHALAVTIAELCTKTEGPLVERAWAVTVPFYNAFAERVADSHTGMLWRPIKKLMNKANGVRQSYLNLQITRLDSHAIISDLTGLGVFGIDEPSTRVGDSVPSFDNYTPGTEENIDHSMDNFQQPSFISGPEPFDWDPWLTTATAMNARTVEQDNVTDEAVWATWEDFLEEFQRLNDGPSTGGQDYSGGG